MTEHWYSEATATFGDRLVAAREASGLAQAELAQRLGVRDTTVMDWEEDQSAPRGNRMQMLAGLLNVSLVWLMTGEGPGIPAPDEGAVEGDSEIVAIRDEVQVLRSALLEAAERAARLERRLSLAAAGAA